MNTFSTRVSYFPGASGCDSDGAATAARNRDPGAKVRGLRKPVLAVAAILLAASGCCSLEDAWRVSHERDRSALRETLPDGEPGDHLGLHIDLARLSALVSDLPEPARPRFERRIALDPDDPGALAVVIRAETTHVTLAAGECDGCLDVALGYRVSLDPDVGEGLKAALGLPAQGLVREGQLAFQARLAIDPQSDGARLLVDVGLGLREALRSALSLLPEKWAGAVGEALTPAGAFLLDQARLGATGLMRLRAARERKTGLSTALRSLHTDREKNQLYLGLATNLSVPRAELFEYRGPADLKNASLRLRAPRGLVEALARAALAGRLGAAAGAGQAAGSDKIRLTLNRLSLEQDKIVLEVKLWRTRFPCLEADVSIAARVARGPNGRISVTLLEPVLERASRGEERLREAIGKKRKKLALVGERLSEFFNETQIDLGASRRLHWNPVDIEIGNDSIFIDVDIQLLDKKQQ